MATSTRSAGAEDTGRETLKWMYERVATPLVCRLALLGVISALVVIAYYPFAWSPPRWVRNEVTRTAAGFLRFGGMNYARTLGTPAWLQAARRSGTIQIQLQADPQLLQQSASMMMLASDYWHTDFAIGQADDDLMVWLRRPGSDVNGDPPFVLAGAIQARRWVDVEVIVQRGNLRIVVDGTTRVATHLGADSLSVWGSGQVALGDEVHGGGPWRGQLRLAEVRTSSFVVDYVQPGALLIPDRFFYFPDRIEPFPPTSTLGQLYLFFEVLSFIPVGFLIVWARRPPIRPIAAVLLSAALAVVLGAGKLLFAERREVLADIVMQVIGACIGALLAWRLASRSLAPDATAPPAKGGAGGGRNALEQAS